MIQFAPSSVLHYNYGFCPQNTHSGEISGESNSSSLNKMTSATTAHQAFSIRETRFQKWKLLIDKQFARLRRILKATVTIAEWFLQEENLRYIEENE